MNNILILEDDETQASKLRDLIGKNILNCNIFVCSTEHEAKDKAILIEFTIMIVDLILDNGSGDNGSGLGFAKWVRTIPKYNMAWIVIVTGHDTFAMEAIKLAHCFDYLVKPYLDSDMLSIVSKLLRSKIINDNNLSYLTVLSKGISFKIKLSEILFIEINNKNMDIHTATKVYSVKRYSLSKIKDQLPKNMFLQCHRSFIVNTEKISAVESRSRDTFIMMNNHDKPIPVGIRYKDMISSDNIL
jgi:DNA-binding LytR/AlgR family response regulator